MAELLGRRGHMASEVVNCSAPNTDVLAKYGTAEQQKQWLEPLLRGEIRSAFSMTERFSAWISGAGDTHTRVHILMGKSDASDINTREKQSVVLVPADTPGVRVIRLMKVFGYDDAPERHCEIIYDNVRVPASNLVLGWGKGFETLRRRPSASTSTGTVSTKKSPPVDTSNANPSSGSVIADIARSRAEIESSRLLVLSATLRIDNFTAKGALKEIGIAKVNSYFRPLKFHGSEAHQFFVPSMALGVIDRASQAYGAEGVCQDQHLAKSWAELRTMRIADGPDAVGQRELRRAGEVVERATAIKKKEKEILEKAGLRSKSHSYPGYPLLPRILDLVIPGTLITGLRPYKLPDRDKSAASCSTSNIHNMSSHPITKYTSESSWALEEVWPANELAHLQLPDDGTRWQTIIPVIEELKEKAKKLGLWNMFLSKRHYPNHGTDYTNLEVFSTPLWLNFSAVEGTWPLRSLTVLLRIPETWVRRPLPTAAVQRLITHHRGFGEIWKRRTTEEMARTSSPRWISGAGDPRCKVHILMGKSDASNPNTHEQQSVVLVPADAPGVKVIRPMKVFGYDDAPEGHFEIIYDNVRVPIIQGRLGPGRIHHCMRSIGAASAALDLMLQRVTDPAKKTFGKYLHEHGSVIADIARSRAEIEGARLLVLSAALQIDNFTAKGALKEIGIAKFVVPTMALGVIDRAIQAFGAEGVCQDQPLAQAWAGLRTLRIADGPDAVHLQQVGQRELRRAGEVVERATAIKRKEKAILEKAGLKSKSQAHL
ncbi:acyl-CoA dehydrogenase [Salix suchowensis]|nr:acyl-CoA dehydrogenase [Salix suchowensis]